RSDSSHGRLSRRETTRQAVKASPAAVPSTATTDGGAARATSRPSSSSTAPSSPSVSAARRGVTSSASSPHRFATPSPARSPASERVEPHAGLLELAKRLAAEVVVAHARHEPDVGAQPRRRDRLVRALPAGHAVEGGAADRLPRPRQPLDARDEVEVDRADDG